MLQQYGETGADEIQFQPLFVPAVDVAASQLYVLVEACVGHPPLAQRQVKSEKLTSTTPSSNIGVLERVRNLPSIVPDLRDTEA